VSNLSRGIPNIIIPTIRDEGFFETFLIEWREEFSGCHLIIVEDRKKAILNNALKHYSKCHNYSYEIWDWNSIDKKLGKNKWIIPRKSSAIRSFGYLMAYHNNAKFILTLDDDTKPSDKGHVASHYNNLFNCKTNTDERFYNTLKSMPSRGTMEDSRQVIAISHGGWINVPDLCAEVQLKEESPKIEKKDFNEGLIPFGAYFGMCGMNLAFKTSMVPYMYFGLQGHILDGKELVELPINRCDDIWAGYYAKKICDGIGYRCHTGKPYVVHNRASNVWSNLKMEENANSMGSEWLSYVNDDVSESSLVEGNSYWGKLLNAYDVWEDLCEDNKP